MWLFRTAVKILGLVAVAAVSLALVILAAIGGVYLGIQLGSFWQAHSSSSTK